MSFLLIANNRFKPSIAAILRLRSISSSRSSSSSNIRTRVLPRNFFQPHRQRIRFFANISTPSPSKLSVDNIFRGDEISEKRRPITKEELERLLYCLENDKPYANEYVILRAPFLCSCTNGLERRFVSVVDRWWLRMRTITSRVLPDRTTLERWDFKPTSIVHHLGRLNQSCQGVVIQKLYALDRLESLSALIDRTSTHDDLCALPDSRDLLSFLIGIQDLAADIGVLRIVHRSLIPSKTGFLRNIERYLREKEIVRKGEYDRRDSKSTSSSTSNGDEWIFMINEEAPKLLIPLLNFGYKFSNSSRSDGDFLNIVCDLTKRGYDHCAANSSTIDVQICEYALYSVHVFLGWKYDPEQSAPGFWRSWCQCYEITCRSQYEGEPNVHLLRRFNLCDSVMGVPRIFQRSAEPFLKSSIFDVLLNDLGQISRLIARLEPKQLECSPTALANTFADAAFNCGAIGKYLDTIKRRDLIERMQPIVLNVFSDALDAMRGRPVSAVALTRYLTGLRDFRSIVWVNDGELRHRFRYSPELNEKLLNFLCQWLDDSSLQERATGRGLRRDDDGETGATRAPDIFFLLCRSRLQLNKDLAEKILRSISDALFEKDRKDGLRRFVANFGESATYYHSSMIEYCAGPVLDDALDVYYRASKLYLDSIEPNTTDDGRMSGQLDIYALSCTLSVAYSYRCIARFDTLKSIWEKRMDQLVDVCSPKKAGSLLATMWKMRKIHRVRFDRGLVEKLKLRRRQETGVNSSSRKA